MSFQERRAIVSLISTIVISAGYFLVVAQRVQDGAWDATPLSFWAGVILLYIPVQVVCKVIIHIVFIIINVIATQKEEPSITDELDRLIDLKSTRNFYHAFMAGFLLSLALLLFESPASVMFSGILATLVVAGIILDASQILYYRRGV